MANKYVTFSFDDGTVFDRRLTEIMRQYGLKGTFNLNSAVFSKKQTVTEPNYIYDHSIIDAAEVKNLYIGQEVASHTLNHPDLRFLEKDEVIRQVNEDIANLEKLVGYEITGLAYPMGETNEQLINILNENTKLKYARTIYYTYGFGIPKNFMCWNPTAWIEDGEVFNLYDKFIKSESEEDVLFYVWGHSYDFEKFKTWDRFLKLADLISKTDGVKCVTNNELFTKMSKIKGK